MADNTLTFTDANFDQETKDGYTLVDFWAPWCGPCRMVGPVIEQLADEYGEKVKVGKLNVDENQKIAMNYRVMSIPTVILFKDGEPVEVMIGAQPKAAYKGKIDPHVQAAVS